jgi:hypothetical protein
VVQPDFEDVKRIERGTLKCVIWSGKADSVPARLLERVSAEDVRELRPGAVVVHTPVEPAELRDWLSGEVGEGESLLIVEFERWSAFGKGVDREWLLARGH